MSERNKQKTSSREKLAWTAAAISTLGGAALFSGPVTHEAPKEQPGVVTEILTADRVEKKVEAPAAELVDKFIADYQRARYKVQQSTGKESGEITLPEVDTHHNGKRTISTNSEANVAYYVDDNGYIGQSRSGSVSANHGDRGTDITLEISNPGISNRIITFHNDGQLAIDFDDLSTLTAAIADKGTNVRSAQIDGSFIDPSFSDATWFTDEGYVTTTFEPLSREGDSKATVDMSKLQQAPDSSGRLPGADDVIEWQMNRL